MLKCTKMSSHNMETHPDPRSVFVDIQSMFRDMRIEIMWLIQYFESQISGVCGAGFQDRIWVIKSKPAMVFISEVKAHNWKWQCAAELNCTIPILSLSEFESTHHNSDQSDIHVYTNCLCRGKRNHIADNSRIFFHQPMQFPPNLLLLCLVQIYSAHTCFLSAHESLSNLSCGMCLGSGAPVIIIRGGEATNK